MSLANKFGIPESLLDAAKKALDEANEYQKKVQAHMAKKGIKSLNDLTPDQKKKFFNDLDAMHTAKNEEVEPIDEAIPKSTMYAVVHSKTKKIITKGNKADMAKKVKELNSKETGSHFLGNSPSKKVGDTFGEEVESVEEAESHQAKTTMKHIKNPTQGEKDASKKMKSGIPGYRDRIAMLHSAKARGALKKEEVELTQEDLDFIASLNQVDLDEEQLDELTTDALHSYLKKREGQTGYVGAKKGVHQSNMMNLARKKIQQAPGSTDQSRYVGSQHAKYAPGHEPAKVAATVKKEEVDLDDFTVEEIQEYMQTEEFAQLDELSKETLGSYIKKRQHDVAAQGAITRQHAVDAEKAKKDNNYSQQRKSNEKSDKAFAKGWKYRQNISKAVDKIVKKA